MRGRAHKYGARKITTIHGDFDSVGEAKWYGDLKLRELAGEISRVRRPEPFDLIVENPITGALTSVGTYRADGAWFEPGVEGEQFGDFKGMDTQQSALRRKLVLALYGIRVRVFTSKGEKKQRRFKGEPAAKKKGRRRLNDDPAHAPAS